MVIRAASIGSAPATPGSPDTAARTWRGSEKGATTSRPAWRSPVSGATLGGPDADTAGVAETAGTVRPASALAPSSGTTAAFPAAALLAGKGGHVAGTVARRPAVPAAPAVLAGCELVVASSTPTAVPASTSTATRSGISRLGLWTGIGVQHAGSGGRSEEHTSELQSQSNLVCR